jgi:hypothetical protein
MGRLHRLGQQTPQKVWILGQVRTFDAYIEDTNILKDLPQVAADLDPMLRATGLQTKTGGRNETAREHDADAETTDNGPTDTPQDTEQEEDRIRRIAVAKLCSILGRRQPELTHTSLESHPPFESDKRKNLPLRTLRNRTASAKRNGRNW